MDLGLKPTLLSMTLIDHLFEVVERHKDRVDLAAIMPTVSWRADHQRSAPHVQRAGPDVSTSEAAAGALSGRRILVTGGSGFIGRHVVAELSRAGAQVRVVDLKPHPDPDVEIVLGDLGDLDVLEAAFAGGIDAVVHLAAVTSVLRSLEHPELTYQHQRRGAPRRCSRRRGRRVRGRSCSPRPTR